MLHGHGDDGYHYKGQIIADFSTNVWYGGEPAGLKEYIFERWSSINRYPEVLGETMAERVAAHHAVGADQVLITNGTTESIYLIAQAFKKSTTSIAVPAFAEYEDACKLHDHQLKFVDWNDLHQDQKLNADLFFICNPNNPTGKVLTDLENLISINPETIFVVDEAFIDFTFSIRTVLHLIDKYDNLIVLRSLTKLYAIPGLRLGYIGASRHLIQKLKSVKAPWTVNSLALASGHFIFDHYQDIYIPLETLLNNKDSFVQELKEIGIETEQSYTHFFLCQTPKHTARELKAYLIDKHGLLIRDASNFRSLTGKHFRLATLAPDKNELLIHALTQWMQ
jgi:threonine-phosphate decarboxylase